MNKNIIEIVNMLIAILIVIYISTIIPQMVRPSGIIGASWDLNKEKEVCIVSLTKGLPAEQAGLQVNDCVVSVDGKDMSGRGVNYAVSKMYGKKYTVINLEVKRDNQILKYQIKRAKRKIDWLLIFRKPVKTK